MMCQSTLPGPTDANGPMSPSNIGLGLGGKVSYSSPTECPAADAKEVGVENPAEEATAIRLKKSSIAHVACQYASEYRPPPSCRRCHRHVWHKAVNQRERVYELMDHRKAHHQPLALHDAGNPPGSFFASVDTQPARGNRSWQGIDPGSRLPPTNICDHFLRKAPLRWAWGRRRRRRFSPAATNSSCPPKPS
jgi:hypothetical protein